MTTYKKKRVRIYTEKYYQNEPDIDVDPFPRRMGRGYTLLIILTFIFMLVLTWFFFQS